MRPVQLLSLACTLTLLFACKATLLKVETQPPGGSVQVVETGQKASHGQSVKLKSGTYTLRSQKKGYRGDTAQVTVQGPDPITVQVPLGEGFAQVNLTSEPSGTEVFVDGTAKGQTPLKLDLPEGLHSIEFRALSYADTVKAVEIQPGVPAAVHARLSAGAVSPVTVTTQPPGAVVTIKEINRTVKNGGDIHLAAGRYTFFAEAEGYHHKAVQVDVDGKQPQTVAIDLGRGFAQVAIKTTPSGAQVSADGRPLGETPVLATLGQGDNTLKIKKTGYDTLTKKVTIAAGQATELVLSLSKSATRAAVRFLTQPTGGKIFLQDNSIGTAPVAAKTVPFGRHTAQGIKTISAVHRITGEMAFSLSDAASKTVTIKLINSERLFEGKWLPAQEALTKETVRYTRQRAANPVMAQVGLTAVMIKHLGGLPDPAAMLHAALRPGDRIKFTQGKRTWLIWKRHEALTEDFKMSVAALLKGKEHPLPWADDPKFNRVQPHLGVSPLVDMITGLHRARADLPLLFLSDGQLAKSKETIQRCRADGPLTMVAFGGKGLAITGIQTSTVGPLSIAQLPAGDNPATVSWQKPPKRLLVTGDINCGLKSPASGQKIQPHEKKIVRLATGKQVDALIRLSAGPDYDNGWNRRLIQPTSPLASQIDLSLDEIGPNDKNGNYQRAWIVRYQSEKSMTQRQIAVGYTVGGELKEFSGDKFLRRSKLGDTGNKKTEKK